ncbi:MAG: hypothetical protein ACYTEP_05400 [Planctomycetota bacterium]
MTPFRLLLLCFLFLGAGLGLWQLAQTQGEAPVLPGIEQAAEDSLLRGDPKELVRLTMEQPRFGQTVVLELVGETWAITEPLADTPEPSSLAAAFQVIYGNDWTAAPEEWGMQSAEDLGLEPPALLMEATYRDGTTELLRVGAEEPTGNWRVARLGEQLMRFPIPGYRKLARPLQQWRDHRLHPLGINISRFTWEPSSGPKLVIEKKEGQWHILEPVQAPLEERALPFFLTLLGGRVDGVGNGEAPRTPEQGKLGDIRLKKGDEEAHLEIFRWGVLSDKRDFLLSYDQRTFQFLELPLEEMVSRRILNLDPGRIASLRIELGPDSADYRLAPDGWVRQGMEVADPKQSAFVAALLDHGTQLERGEALEIPAGAPAGRILYSISRRPQEKGSKILRWWVDPEGRNLVASEPGSNAYESRINFDLGVRSLFEESP